MSTWNLSCLVSLAVGSSDNGQRNASVSKSASQMRDLTWTVLCLKQLFNKISWITISVLSIEYAKRCEAKSISDKTGIAEAWSIWAQICILISIRLSRSCMVEKIPSFFQKKFECPHFAMCHILRWVLLRSDIARCCHSVRSMGTCRVAAGAKCTNTFSVVVLFWDKALQNS